MAKWSNLTHCDLEGFFIASMQYCFPCLYFYTSKLRLQGVTVSYEKHYFSGYYFLLFFKTRHT